MGITNLFKSRATKLQEAKTAAMQEQGFYKAVNLWDAYEFQMPANIPRVENI